MSLDTLQQALDALRTGATDAPAFCRTARSLDAAAGLPPRYGEVLASLLDRLESAQLFDGESCSFSQQDLVDGLQQWLDKARSAS